MSAIRKTDEVAETAALYAVGKLPEEEARRFEQRLQSGCPYCMAELQGCQRAVEELVLVADPVAPAPGLEAKLLERIGGSPKAGAEVVSNEPTIVRQDESDWVDSPQPGVKLRFLHRKRTMLVKMDPGARYPSHVHALDEQCLVLEGSVQDGEGRIARAGDYVFMAKGSTHPPFFSENGALFLIAYT
jgi:quercetin dioxygenase-like cupin family protein